MDVPNPLLLRNDSLGIIVILHTYTTMQQQPERAKQITAYIVDRRSPPPLPKRGFAVVS